MINLFLIVLLITLMSLLTGCEAVGSNAPHPGPESTAPVRSSSPAVSKSISPPPAESLTTAKVETAIESLLDEFRFSGSVRVSGIQEQPAQNTAIADLQFDVFEYATSFEGNLLKKKNFNPKPLPQDKTRLPSPEEMFPPKRTIYSKDGRAILARYTDGRWILKEVRWDFDKGVKGSVEVR